MRQRILLAIVGLMLLAFPAATFATPTMVENIHTNWTFLGDLHTVTCIIMIMLPVSTSMIIVPMVFSAGLLSEPVLIFLLNLAGATRFLRT